MLWPENLRYVVRDVVNPAWKQIYPLREDINLQLFQPLAELHANVNFDKQFKLNERQEVFIKDFIYSLIQFVFLCYHWHFSHGLFCFFHLFKTFAFLQLEQKSIYEMLAILV